jgi:hypothetical protein
MFPAVEGHRRIDFGEDDKKDEGEKEKNARVSPELVTSTSNSKL